MEFAVFIAVFPTLSILGIPDMYTAKQTRKADI